MDHILAITGRARPQSAFYLQQERLQLLQNVRDKWELGTPSTVLGTCCLLPIVWLLLLVVAHTDRPSLLTRTLVWTQVVTPRSLKRKW